MVKNKKIIIAGPCAAETKNGLVQVVEGIHHYVDVIRVGIWKARTCPKSYAGRGLKALSWVSDLQKKHNTPFAIEVGSREHVKLALQYNIKILWIGARTTANPFSIQEIAEELRGSDVELWIKNPIFPNLDLFHGAIKRFHLNHCNKLKIIHRGFYDEFNTEYRNSPRWDLLHKIKKSYPSTPIICDPSHIAGQRDLIYPVAQQALNNDIDGLMIEVHHKPEKALSDTKQQLSIKEFINTLTKLNLK